MRRLLSAPNALIVLLKVRIIIMHRYPVMISLLSIALKLMLSIRSCALLVSISLVIISTYLAPCLFDHSAFAQSADDVSRAVELDKEAKQMISEGKYHEATELYREALTIIDHPDLLINLAKAELQLGESQSAFNACSRALASPLLTPQAREAAASCVSEAQIQMNQIRAFVRTYPSGANLRLDGRSLGQAPWEGQVAPGRRQFDFELDGHVPVSRSVNAVPGAQLKLQVRMIPQGMGGLISLRTTPKSANIILDNEFIGQSPVISFPVSKGSHSLEIKFKGYLDERHQVSVSEGQNQKLNFFLKPVRGRVSATDLWPAWGLMSAGMLTGVLAGYFGYRALNSRNQADDLALTDGSAMGYDEYRFLIRDMNRDQETSDILWTTSGLMLTSGLTWWLIVR